MRTAPAPARPIGARDARGMRLPSQRTWGTPVEPDRGGYTESAGWYEEVECEPVVRHDLFTSLVEPERADTLDFTDFMPAVRVTRDVPSRRKPAVRASTLADLFETRELGALGELNQPARPAQPARSVKPVGVPRTTLVIPAVRAEQPRLQRPQQPHPLARRVAQASMRLADLGAMRPVVRIPARPASDTSNAGAGGLALKQAKLPPVWLLANALILIAAIVTILPRVVPADAAAGCSWHTVVPGDTLGNLGWVYHTNALALAQANHIENPNLIYVGQRLCIPMVAGAHTATEPTVNAGAKPVPTGTAKGVQAFLAFAEPYARQAHNATGWPVSMILAQWGLEQAWRVPGYTGYNFGNVAALPGQPTVNGIAVPGSPARFAYAQTPDDGLSYYIRVAHLSFYSAVAPAAASGGPDAAARALGKSPWDAAHYTAIGSPGSSLVSLIHKYNLYTYDQ